MTPTIYTEADRYELQYHKTIFNNTLFKVELVVQLVFGNPDTNQNPNNVNVIVLIFPIALIKPITIKKDDRDKRSLLIFSFVTENQ